MGKWTWMKRYVKDERGALGGLPVDLLLGILMAYGLVILYTIFVTLLKAFVASVGLINFAQAYSMHQNGIDPSTNVPYVQEASKSFANTLPVTDTSSDIAYLPPSIGTATQPGELALYIGGDPTQKGFDELTVDYAIQLPLKIPTWNGNAWTTVSPKPFQLYFNLDFYQEW